MTPGTAVHDPRSQKTGTVDTIVAPCSVIGCTGGDRLRVVFADGSTLFPCTSTLASRADGVLEIHD